MGTLQVKLDLPTMKGVVLRVTHVQTGAQTYVLALRVWRGAKTWHVTRMVVTWYGTEREFVTARDADEWRFVRVETTTTKPKGNA